LHVFLLIFAAFLLLGLDPSPISPDHIVGPYTRAFNLSFFFFENLAGDESIQRVGGSLEKLFLCMELRDFILDIVDNKFLGVVLGFFCKMNVHFLDGPGLGLILVYLHFDRVFDFWK
jgi:hypothetical protein